MSSKGTCRVRRRRPWVKYAPAAHPQRPKRRFSILLPIRDHAAGFRAGWLDDRSIDLHLMMGLCLMSAACDPRGRAALSNEAALPMGPRRERK